MRVANLEKAHGVLVFQLLQVVPPRLDLLAMARFWFPTNISVIVAELCEFYEPLRGK